MPIYYQPKTSSQILSKQINDINTSCNLNGIMACKICTFFIFQKIVCLKFETNYQLVIYLTRALYIVCVCMYFFQILFNYLSIFFRVLVFGIFMQKNKLLLCFQQYCPNIFHNERCSGKILLLTAVQLVVGSQYHYIMVLYIFSEGHLYNVVFHSKVSCHVYIYIHTVFEQFDKGGTYIQTFIL